MYSYNKTPFTQVISGLKQPGYILTVQMKYANDSNLQFQESISMQPRRKTLRRASSASDNSKSLYRSETKARF